MANYKKDEWLVNLPLYAVEEIRKRGAVMKKLFAADKKICLIVLSVFILIILLCCLIGMIHLYFFSQYIAEELIARMVPLSILAGFSVCALSNSIK